MSENPTKVPVPQPVSTLLVKLYRGLSLPEKLEPTKVTQFLWDGRDFSSSARELCGGEGAFSLKCGGTDIGGIEKDLNLLASNQLINKPIQGLLADGRVFHAEFGHTSNDRMKLGGETSHEVIVEGPQWHVVPREGIPSLWIGKINGKTNHVFGNLSVHFDQDEQTRTSEAANLRLAGTYVYYLVCRQDAWFLIVDTGSGMVPDRHALWRDFLALEFALGQQMRLRTLCGLNEAGAVVAYTGGYYGEDHPRDIRQSPVPIMSGLEVPLFEAVSKAWNAHPELRWGIALQSYLDGFTSNIEVAYLRLQVAIESFAYWILKARGELDYVLVEDVKKWEAWVKNNKEAIRSQAKGNDENLATALYLKVKMAYERSTGKLIRDTFKLFQLDTTKEMDKELRSRDLSVHMMQMSPDGYELDRDMQRINLIRALLVALIAKASGYQGAIADQALLDGGTWWKPDPAARNKVHYVAEESTKIKPGATKADPAIQALLKEVAKGEIGFKVVAPGPKIIIPGPKSDEKPEPADPVPPVEQFPAPQPTPEGAANPETGGE